MHYKWNFALMIVVFSIVTYNVCMAYQAMDDTSVKNKFETIGLLESEAFLSGNKLAAR